MIRHLILAWSLAVLLVLPAGVGAPPGNENGCLSCHQGIEAPGKGHRFPCQRCHGGDQAAAGKDQAHHGMAANPSSLDQAAGRCGPCHARQVQRVPRSLMATSAGEINPTRTLWGAQPRESVTYLNHAIDGYPGLPHPDRGGALVDDLLRRRCLRCHLHSPGAGHYGAWRAAGCAACHMPYGPDGFSRSGDRALAGHQEDIRQGKKPQRRGYPLQHRLTRQIPTTQCLTCHHGHRVGMDFVGLAERDYEESYRFNAPDGESPSLIYGMDPRSMTPDIHHERGLICIDCHNGREVMGTGSVSLRAGDQVSVRCRDCHGEPGRPPQRRNLIGKLSGKKHAMPTLDRTPSPVDHRIPEHIQNMECHSCHALWSYQDFGFHLLREDRADYQKWSSLWLQNDPQVQERLRANLPRPRAQWEAPRSRDYLDGGNRPGLWFFGYSYRRFENPIFGINSRGRTSVYRPLAQFVVSHVDERGRVLLDSRVPRTMDGKPGLGFNPYAPHTIRRPVRACEGCHLNPRALGLGNRVSLIPSGGKRLWSGPLTFPGKDGNPIPFEWEALVDLAGKPLQTQTRPGARPYNRQEIKGLLSKSKAYQGWYTRHYQEKGLY